MLPSEVDVPYPAWPIPEASPARIAALATIAGFRPESATNCRMLELGCASGGNLLPLACSLPEARFVGVDLDAGEIAEASSIAGELGLENVRLLAMSVEDVLAALPSERFDYIVAHGLYSWVPERARNALMELCGALLSEHGVVYVSYNTLPGFELRQVVRDALRFHCRDETSARRALLAARPFLERLLASPLAASSKLVQSELLASSKAKVARLVYDDLGETEAFYFEDVVEHGARSGLRFLGEAVPSGAHVRSFGGSAGRRLAELASDRLAQEALLDVLMLRRFRRSLFCRACTAPAKGEAPTELDSLYALARFERPDVAAIAQIWTLPGIAGAKVIVDSAHVRAGLWSLAGRYPASTQLSELRALAATLASKHAPGCGQVSANAFNANILELFEAGVVELLGAPPRCGQAGARPAAFHYARVAARRGRPIPSLHHRQVALEDEEVRLLGLLDGRKTRPQLALEMRLPEQGQDGVEGLLRRLELAALLAAGD